MKSALPAEAVFFVPNIIDWACGRRVQSRLVFIKTLLGGQSSYFRSKIVPRCMQKAADGMRVSNKGHTLMSLGS